VKRFARYLLTLCVALSLLLCLVACVLWARSYWQGNRLSILVERAAPRQTPEWWVSAVSGNGGLGLSLHWSARYFNDDESWREALRDRERRGTRYLSYDRVVTTYPRWSRGGLGLGAFNWHRGGFQLARSVESRKSYYAVQRSIVLPYWVVVLLTATWPALRLSRGCFVNRRRQLGLCVRCGYDLRVQLATSQRCPECGTAPATMGGM
jgi:hypothetical protein